ncbi:MAG: carbohydrate ABC transporter permease [Lachnospiraceae bacterium]|jgi:multiple sugar transport system permease protein|nr:carbohydrate ABC transporter permease [Lachnospiraceae bacterium]MCH4029882.1 carbohydrate ABC transporter permease [Lachnospiraceae bacterium]MCH4109399.1 carbohydrate ABC transporter permease [Lachnospiraceae bacterium]MCI1303053.1 carbohydrate ABC transporter permease [Lachnospiraceae bacterium]MCI1332357.1 carbohydrate ABC transporter permease [Lachnospiraceae bacterium]
MKETHAVYSPGTKVARAIGWIFLTLLAVLIIFPVLYIIFGSFKSNSELLVGGSNIFPTVWSVSNYIQAWQQANFAVYTKNSLILALGVMILSLVTSTMAGYVFSRTKFRGSTLLYGVFIAFMFINTGSVSIRPLYELAVNLHMNNNLFSVIFISTGTGQATYIFLAKGFVDSLPKELDEAAKIDGCTFFQTFYKVIAPLLKPVIATIALLSFRQGWNEYVLPLVFTMSNDAMRPLTVGVNMLKNAGDGTAAWNIMFAGATIAIVPMILVYIFFQRYFMGGVAAGAVKG